MKFDTRKEQKAVCKQFNAEVFETYQGDKVGISQSALEGLLPLNGLRHPYSSGVSGWYIWGGEELSDAEDFFLPLHVGHLELHCSLCLKYLLLPPGWRFLTDGRYEDVWFDAELLVIEDS